MTRGGIAVQIQRPVVRKYTAHLDDAWRHHDEISCHVPPTKRSRQSLDELCDIGRYKGRQKPKRLLDLVRPREGV